MKSTFRFPGTEPAAAPPPSQPRAGFSVHAPCVVLLGAPHALARSMAHSLQQARRDAGHTTPWQCLAPESESDWPCGSLVYVLGQDWRDATPDSLTEQQIMQWRRRLDAQSHSYVMLYGKASAQWQQLAASLQCIAPTTDWDWISTQNPWNSSPKIRRKACEQCGDPTCELTLFEALKSAV